MKSMLTFGGILGVLLVLGIFAWMASGTADAQPGLPPPPPATDPIAPLATLPQKSAQAPDLGSKSIEQLIDYITGLKKQRMELENLEAKAVAILRQKLTEATQKAAQFGGFQEERKIEAKDPVIVRPSIKKD